MPSLPPGLEQWLPSGLVTAVLAMVWYEIKASEARQNKRIDELREDMKEGFAQFRAAMQASEARQREDMAQLKADNRALGEKLDRLVEGMFAARQS